MMLCGLSVVLLFVAVNEYFVADAFVVNYKSVDMISSSIIRKSSIERRIPSHLYAEEEKNDKSFLDAMQPWKIDVPEEYREEILRAEGNTQVAKDRNTRVAIYLTITFVCISIAIVNAFLTTLRQDDPNAISDLGWDWVQSNFLFSFLFTNGIGGAIALVLAGVCGTTAELEQRSRNDNAERIWKELQRRKESSQPKKKKKKDRKNKKGMKNKKRLSALSEVIDDESKVAKAVPEEVTSQDTKEEASSSPVEAETKKVEETKEEGGIFGKVKELYEKADAMAASQALLLNKELEDRGVVEKITDESGLRVIGKEEAAKLAKKNESSD